MDLSSVRARIGISAMLLLVGLSYPVTIELFSDRSELRLRRVRPPSVPAGCSTGAIFGRNGRVAVATSVSGMTAGVATVPILLSTGFTVGLPLSRAYRVGTPPRRIAAVFLPHALVELPAICLAGAAGLTGAAFLARRLRSVSYPWRTALAEWSLLSAASLLLLVLAAVFECHVTPRVHDTW